jgi:uncharacterized membrane protein HdeD (DUF308 family)
MQLGITLKQERRHGKPTGSKLVDNIIAGCDRAAALLLLYVIAAWAIITGIFEIIAAIQMRQEIRNEWLLAIAGVASVLFGLLLTIWPLAGALAILWLIGGYAIVFGILLLILGFRLRSWRNQEPPPLL